MKASPVIAAVIEEAEANDGVDMAISPYVGALVMPSLVNGIALIGINQSLPMRG